MTKFDQVCIQIHNITSSKKKKKQKCRKQVPHQQFEKYWTRRAITWRRSLGYYVRVVLSTATDHTSSSITRSDRVAKPGSRWRVIRQDRHTHTGTNHLSSSCLCVYVACPSGSRREGGKRQCVLTVGPMSAALRRRNGLGRPIGRVAKTARPKTPG